MNILYVSECYYPAIEYGGPISRMLAISKGLIAKGHRLTVYTSDILNPHQRITPMTCERNLGGVRVVYLHSVFQYRWNTIGWEIVRYCFKELKSFDLIHIYGYRNLLFVVVTYFARRWRIPYVVEPLGSVPPLLRSHTKKRIFDWTFGNVILSAAHRVIVNSHKEQTDLVACRLPAPKIAVIPNAIDLAEYDHLPSGHLFRAAHRISRDEKVVLFLGRIFRIKGLDLLIRAFAQLKLFNIRLVIAGPPEDRNYLQELHQLAEELGIMRKIIFIGPLSGIDKLSAYTAADLFVLPSSNENFGNVVAEAIACGTPVVVTDRCGIAPQVKDCAGLVVEHDLHQMTKAMERLLTDEALYNRFVENTKWVRNTFSAERIIDQLEKLYLEIRSASFFL